MSLKKSAPFIQALNRQTLNWIVITTLIVTIRGAACHAFPAALPELLGIPGVSPSFAERTLQGWIDDAASGIRLEAVDAQVDGEYRTVRFQEYRGGVPVLGAGVLKHEGPTGMDLTDLRGRFDLDPRPRLAATEAVALSRVMAPRHSLRAPPRLAILPEADRTRARLIYQLSLDSADFSPGREIWIDANSGELIADLPEELSAEAPARGAANGSVTATPRTTTATPSRPIPRPVAPIQVYSGIPKPGEEDRVVVIDKRRNDNPAPDSPKVLAACQVVEVKARIAGATPLVINLQNCNRLVIDSRPTDDGRSDRSAWHATRNAARVLEYYKRHHGRASYDGRGSQIVQIVHAGRSYANARWRPRENLMIYGDGDGRIYGDFTLAADLAGHEMTHGVIFSSSKLIPKGESGALGEALADYFGKLIAADGTWAVGKGALVRSKTGAGLRNLANPGSIRFMYDEDGRGSRFLPMPSQMNEKIPTAGRDCTERNDYCWIHINATIPGHAAYRIHKAIGEAKAEKLIYLVMTQHLTSNASFNDFSSALRSACAKLYDDATCSTVRDTLLQIGL